MQESIQSLDALAQTFLVQWLEKDLKPWLSSAKCSLLGSSLLPQLPKFPADDLRLVDEQKQKLTEWKQCMTEMSTLTTKMTDNSANPSDVCRVMAKLTTVHGQMNCAGKLHKVYEMHIPVFMSLQRISEDYYAKSLSDALSIAGNALAPSVVDSNHAFQTIDEDTWKSSIAKCDKASYLSTGIEDVDMKQALGMSISTVKFLLSAAFRRTAGSVDSCSVSYSDCLPPFHVLCAEFRCCYLSTGRVYESLSVRS